MRRVSSPVRADWQLRCEQVGFNFHTIDGPYWNESVAYEFSEQQINHLEAVTEDLHERMLAAVEWIVGNGNFAPFRLPALAIEEITRSWRRGDPALYGRFDFSWNGHDEPMLLEYNADTPTALLEASVVQWHWLQDVRPQADQFNSLHEKLIERWQQLRESWPAGTVVHFAACADHDEDQGNTAYLLDTASQAGLQTAALCIEDLGIDPMRNHFIDTRNQRITHCFKLYPWEWMFQDEFAAQLPRMATRFIEPAWKLLLSSKAILPILSMLNPDHPNILPASFAADLPRPFVRKPLYSREGSNVSLVTHDVAIDAPGPYGDEGFVYQAAAALPEFDGRFPVIGSWIVGDRAAGMGIREDHSPITLNTSQFIPHYFT